MFFLFKNQVEEGPVGSLEKDEATLANYLYHLCKDTVLKMIQ